MKKIIVQTLFMLSLVACIQPSKNTVATITENEFERMVTESQVKQILIEERQKLVRVTLTEEAFQLDKYKSRFKNSLSYKTPVEGPHFRFEVLSLEGFYTDLKKYAKEHSKFEVIKR